LTVDIALISLGSTVGLRAADAELAGSLERAGARVALVQTPAPREVRTFALTDLGWAISARRAAREELHRNTPLAVIYSSITAALFWPRPGAIRFDAPAASNRPGRHGLWQRPTERFRLRQASLLLPQSEAALREAPPGAVSGDRALIVPVPVEPSGTEDVALNTAEAATSVGTHARDIDAITYAANPSKKGLDRVLEAWRAVRLPGEELVVAGTEAEDLRRGGYTLPEEGVRVVGRLSSTEYRALLRRARVFVCAPRREDYGIAQLEALADGCLLVTAPAPGSYEALPIARQLDARLVGDDLGVSLRAALDDPRPGYAQLALQALEPYSRAAIDRLVAEQLLPRLLPSG
jgi:hypothetical protein